MKHWRFPLGMILSGAAAGCVTGLFGAGGGMVLVPLLMCLTDLEETEIFPASVSIILPICILCLALTSGSQGLPWRAAFPYLIGSLVGGVLSGILGKKIPVLWLHRVLGILILWGGLRYLWA